MVSPFDPFQYLIQKYPFDTICLSKTWLTDNEDFLNYDMACNSRLIKRGAWNAY